jgi:hypothetical protein
MNVKNKIAMKSKIGKPVVQGLFTATLAIAMVFTFSCSSDNNDSGGGKVVALNKYMAEQSPYIGNDKIKYSYSYEGYDFYYIHLGKMKNIPLFSHPAQHHNGMNSTYTVEITETIKNSTTKTIESSIKTTKSVIDENTKTADIKTSQEIKTSFPIKIVKAEVKVAAEEHWNYYTKSSTEFRETTSMKSTVTTGTEYTKTTMQSRTWNFTSSNNVGYYRYTLFSASDVYLYVVKDSKTGEIDYEFREYIIPDTYFWQLDYSETPSFGKSDDTGFEFDVSMLNKLPKTDTSFALIEPQKKTLIKEFTTAGNHTYTFDEGFPAIVEVYALGGGGGGQGGHKFDRWWVGSPNFSGTGGQGGGGAAAYMKFSLEGKGTFNITVGHGGDGNSGRYRKATMTDDSWLTGNSGNSGESSSVRIGLKTIIAGGGSGGNGGGGGHTGEGNGGSGGNGGSVGPKPANILDWLSANGGVGRGGSKDGTTSPINNAASINIGSFIPFPNANETGRGGYGGYSDTGYGQSGGHGKVLIVITYYK